MHDPMDPVLVALRTALAARPDPALHLAVGDRLQALGDAAAALEAYAAALAMQPAHLDALGKAADAAAAAGQADRAEGYRRLHLALGGAPGPRPLRLAAVGPAAGAEQPDDGVEPQAAPLGRESNVIRLVEPPADPDATTFADIGGLEAVKRRIDLSFLAPMREPALFRAYGKAIKGGMLLYGPPGCGKTHIARATAGEVGARFTSVGLIDVLDMWIGESEKRLHELFEAARRQAPTVLFLDELDALGQKRSQLRHNAGRNLVNQLLVELDGLDSGDGVYVIAATNHPWDVDAALKRPGRFDRTVLVPPPDAPARAHILQRHMRGRPQEGLDFAVLAAKTDRFSGADLVHLADTAVEGVLEEALQGGGLRPVRMADFARALGEVKSSIGPWVEVARNYALYANESGAWDELAAWLKGLRG
ncbi:ATP-binding protein [Myxococcota bacterium]|nr:ATP-binding protein [Myxococcota bacterium]